MEEGWECGPELSHIDDDLECDFRIGLTDEDENAHPRRFLAQRLSPATTRELMVSMIASLVPSRLSSGKGSREARSIQWMRANGRV